MDTTGLPNWHIFLQGQVSPTDTTGRSRDRPRTCVLGVSTSRVPHTLLAQVPRVPRSLQTPPWTRPWPSPGGCLHPRAGVMEAKPKGRLL